MACCLLYRGDVVPKVRLLYSQKKKPSFFSLIQTAPKSQANSRRTIVIHLMPGKYAI